MDRLIARQPTWPRARLHLIEEGRAGGAARHGAAISIAISILFPLTWQWRSIIDCNIERHVFPITAPALSISLRRRRRRRRTPLPRIRIHFVHPSPPFDLPSHFLGPLIIITRIGEAETKMGKKNAAAKGGKRSVRPSRENDCNVMYFLRNPFRNSREYTFSQIRLVLFPIFRPFQYLRGDIPAKSPESHLVSVLLYLAVPSPRRVL